jgi:hypothetical protein
MLVVAVVVHHLLLLAVQQIHNLVVEVVELVMVLREQADLQIVAVVVVVLHQLVAVHKALNLLRVDQVDQVLLFFVIQITLIFIPLQVLPKQQHQEDLELTDSQIQEPFPT